MNGKNIYWYITGTLLLFLSSCIVQKEIDIEVLKPAEFDLPTQYTSVVLVDNSKDQPAYIGNYYVQKDLSPTGIEKETKRYARNDTLSLDSLGAACVFNTANTLLNSEFLDTVIVWEKNTSNPLRSHSMQMLSPTQVRLIADSSKADLVISLDLFTYETEIRYTAWFNEVYDLYASTIYKAIWRFYDGSTMQLLDRKTILDTLYFDVYYNDVDEPGFLETMITESAWAAGEASARKMFPYWKGVKRVFFISGSPGLRLGKRYYERGRLEEAAAEWIKVYETTRKKDKSRAAFNLALFYELQGNLNQSLNYLHNAKLVYDDSNVLLKSSPEYKLILSYIDVIEKRIEEEDKVKKQL